jgi:DNA-binding winged helix-turn-helix (wHTH) protein
MRINSAFTGFFNNRLVVSSAIAIAMPAIFFIALSFTRHSESDVRAKQVNLIIRQIGHRLLLQAGDSTSRVLPVTEIKEGTFLLRFENEFIFNHDSLRVLSLGLLPKTQFPSGYTVTVHDCMKGDIAYGFQINNTFPDIQACSGRRQPPGCYTIEFTFPDFYENIKKKNAGTTTFGYPLRNVVYGGILVLLCVALLIRRAGKIVKPVPVEDQKNAIVKESVPELAALGKFLVDSQHQRLLLGSEVISLTDKEYKVLELLNKSFGELTSRETLMQEVWINEGVITGRSLDMFISKLRKKLSRDPELRITNVHGKGYKLEMMTVDSNKPNMTAC